MPRIGIVIHAGSSPFCFLQEGDVTDVGNVWNSCMILVRKPEGRDQSE
jgi:hypothetical protein